MLQKVIVFDAAVMVLLDATRCTDSKTGLGSVVHHLDAAFWPTPCLFGVRSGAIGI